MSLWVSTLPRRKAGFFSSLLVHSYSPWWGGGADAPVCCSPQLYWRQSPQRDRPTCPCKSLHLKKPPRTDFQGDQTSSLAVSAGLFWGLTPTPQLICASTPKAASLPRGCISLKCLVIQEQLLPCPPNPIVFLKSVGCF